MLDPKNVGSKKVMTQEIEVKNNVGPKIFGSEKIWGPKKFGVQKFWVQQILGKMIWF